MIGHALGASGGLEAIATIKAINTGWLHPTINQDVVIFATIYESNNQVLLECDCYLIPSVFRIWKMKSPLTLSQM